MEDIRNYRYEEEPKERREEESREFEAARAEDEVPFHIPRD